jgi:F0F1-type ATP synthase membrane subunit b/b'
MATNRDKRAVNGIRKGSKKAASIREDLTDDLRTAGSENLSQKTREEHHEKIEPEITRIERTKSFVTRALEQNVE